MFEDWPKTVDTNRFGEYIFSMELMEQLSLLEQRIEALVARCEAHAEEKGKLQARIRELEEENERYRQERGVIRKRIEALVGRID